MCWIVFFKQRPAYEMRISDWSSDVCSSDLTSARYESAPTGSRAKRQAAAVQSARGLLRRSLPFAIEAQSRGLLASRYVRVRPWPAYRRGRHSPCPRRPLFSSAPQLRRALCRGRVVPYVEIQGVDVSIKKKLKG